MKKRISEPKFPTKREFLAWWEGKKDRRSLSLFRAETCPLARCLRARGFRDPWVSSAYWTPNGYVPVLPLPKWAQQMVRKFDEEMKG